MNILHKSAYQVEVFNLIKHQILVTILQDPGS